MSGSSHHKSKRDTVRGTSGPERLGVVSFSAAGTALPQTILHHDLTRTFFAISEEELERLKKSFESDWRDPCLVSLSIFLATGLNAVAEGLDPAATAFTPTVPLFVNCVCAAASFVLGTYFGWRWWKSGRERRKLIATIRTRPGTVLDETTLRKPPEAIAETAAPIPSETSTEAERSRFPAATDLPYVDRKASSGSS